MCQVGACEWQEKEQNMRKFYSTIIRINNKQVGLMTKDYILRGTVHNNNFRVFAVNSTNCVQTARDL